MDSRKAELVSRKIIHTGRILGLEVDRVKLPTGHTVDMEIVRHPGSVVLLPIPEPGKIILIRRSPLHDRSLDLGAPRRQPQAWRRSG